MELAAHLVKSLLWKPQDCSLYAGVPSKWNKCHVIRYHKMGTASSRSPSGERKVVGHKLCVSVRCAERWVDWVCRLWGRRGMTWWQLQEAACTSTGSVATSVFNLLAPELFFFNFSTPVYKMWIIQEPNMLELWNKLRFEEKTESVYRV